jgi:tryptophanyl-tRNA synthetase
MQKLAGKAKVIFSGIQPTGVPHLGNYIGALRQWVQLQQSEEPSTKLIYSIVDLHAITMPQPPGQLRKRKREALAALLAIGIDPERATLFYQSSVGHDDDTPIPYIHLTNQCVGPSAFRTHVDSQLHRVCGISFQNDSMESKFCFSTGRIGL